MKLPTLYKKALYRDLRSALGYYDARRIMRFIEEDTLTNSLDGLERALADRGVDPRQIGLTVEIARVSGFPTNETTN